MTSQPAFLIFALNYIIVGFSFILYIYGPMTRDDGPPQWYGGVGGGATDAGPCICVFFLYLLKPSGTHDIASAQAIQRPRHGVERLLQRGM